MKLISVRYIPLFFNDGCMRMPTTSWDSPFLCWRSYSQQPHACPNYRSLRRIFAAMRVVGEIPHSDCKITIFHWNNRYLIKLERGPFEQTFKIQEYDLTSEEEVR